MADPAREAGMRDPAREAGMRDMSEKFREMGGEVYVGVENIRASGDES